MSIASHLRRCSRNHVGSDIEEAVSRAVDGELLTLCGESVAGLRYPGAATSLPGVWCRVEADMAAVLGGVTLAAPLPVEDGTLSVTKGAA
ncbi:hypothetical protein [Streptomyces sp. VRA16 Mangrove soil]|uniref:hypothetical protein n=1 Tax=Streptomyces sp. VRA16 Mangrove soil TaxID=2817434 RepID=UPI001A9D4D6F|nr:hypothetical protein [Streptomyces sp. VRA16 Mangrove soil]